MSGILTLRKVARVLDELQQEYPGMTIPTAVCFTVIALNPGITNRQVEPEVSISPSAVQRHIALLSDRPGNLGLVTQRDDPNDLRLKPLYLTKKGMALASRLVHQIEGKTTWQYADEVPGGRRI